MASSSSVLRSSLRSERPIPPPQLRPRSSRAATSRRSISSASRPPSQTTNAHNAYDDAELERVRVAVRLRPRNAEDNSSDADFSDCVELQPELNRLKLRKNNWCSESFKFDEVLPESASQKRVYEVVAKPVVESVLNGYNGTVMAYGQTGTGKTYTLGRLGNDDPSERGIMVRALEDIIAATTPSDTVAVSYLQLYLESIQDLLAPETNNIPIAEDPKTGDVSLPGASIIKVQDLEHCHQLLQIGEANRHAANTKLNTESSRSHAILMVYVQKPAKGEVENAISSLTNNTQTYFPGGDGVPVVRRSKLLIVDLAGSERVDKSGSEGHTFEEAKFINLSLTSLGKCVNALAENSPHIPTRDSKLTRLLRDSFGGSARTSLVVTIWPSAQHYTETASTIMFGQRATKVVNMIKQKEEFDYEGQCRKLECEIDYLTAEIERQQKLRETSKELMDSKVEEYQNSLAEVERSFAAKYESLEKEKMHLELENKSMLDELNLQKDQNDHLNEEVTNLEMSLMQSKVKPKEDLKITGKYQNQLDCTAYQKLLADTTQMYEKKVAELLEQIEDEHLHFQRAQELAEMNVLLSNHQRSLQEMLYEELQTALKRLEDEEKQKKSLKDEVIKFKNLVSENNFESENHMLSAISTSDINQEKIVEEGGLDALLHLLGSSRNATIQRVAAGAIANLAMNEKLHVMLKEDGGTKALVGMSGCGHHDVIAQVARGIANFAKCESRGIKQGQKRGRSFLIEDGVLAWVIANSSLPISATRRHVELALCHLAQNEDNAQDFVSTGALKELIRISRESSREDIRNLARKSIELNPTLLAEMRRH
ncbi:hypothetical protein ACLOJK_015853 [Asimina triloba]